MLLWTPPHFWALALLLERRYAAADVPMLPVVRGTRRTAAQVLVYSVALTVLTLVPAALGTFGVVYLVTAVVLGLTLCALAVRLWRRPRPAAASALFHFSLLYLALLFAAVAIDAACGSAKRSGRTRPRRSARPASGGSAGRSRRRNSPIPPRPPKRRSRT